MLVRAIMLAVLFLPHSLWGKDVTWQCHTNVTNRTGTVDHSRCQDPQQGTIACYEEVERRCRHERHWKNKSFRHYTGTCVRSFNECWVSQGNATLEGEHTLETTLPNEINQSQAWKCNSQIKDRSGTMNPSQCPNSNEQIACYEEITEICDEEYSSKKTERTYKRFTGKCSKSYNGCW
mgnify:CR=1 FL=1